MLFLFLLCVLYGLIFITFPFLSPLRLCAKKFTSRFAQILFSISSMSSMWFNFHRDSFSAPSASLREKNPLLPTALRYSAKPSAFLREKHQPSREEKPLADFRRSAFPILCALCVSARRNSLVDLRRYFCDFSYVFYMVKLSVRLFLCALCVFARKNSLVDLHRYFFLFLLYVLCGSISTATFSLRPLRLCAKKFTSRFTQILL
jgi:hypothetical protein